MAGLWIRLMRKNKISADVSVEAGIEAYNEYLARNADAQDYGGYNGSRRSGAVNPTMANTTRTTATSAWALSCSCCW